VSDLLVDGAVVLLFIVIGGLFNAAEVAMISLREAQIRQLARSRGRNGRVLEQLVHNPAKFLASVQIGVTVATMLSSAFGAATISDTFADWLIEQGMRASVAGPVALVAITLVISFFSLVLGELAPKRLGLQASERIALIAARPLSVVARIFRPVVALLSRTSDLVVRLFGGDPKARREQITEDELQSIVEAHEGLSGFERRVVQDVFDANDTMVSEVMVPRVQLNVLPASISVGRGRKLALEHVHSRFLVIGRDTDDVVGVVHIRDLLMPSHPLGRAATVGDLTKPVVSLPGTKSVLEALQEMRHSGDYLAVVVDEYGGTDGIVTLEDLIEEIVGEMTDAADAPDSQGRTAVSRVDAGLNLDDFRELTGIDLPPGPYQTLAGYMLYRLGRIPAEGDRVQTDGHEFAVAEMQGRRMTAVTVVPGPLGDDAEAPGGRVEA